MTVQEIMKLLAHADPNAEVCAGPALRHLSAVHIEHGVPGQILPYVVLLAKEAE